MTDEASDKRARANGRHVGSRGRIAKAIIDDYNWEHSDAPYDPDR
ncbi:hypothetical protein ACFHW2_20995 [Actinomadura sp. LOL_016]